MAAIARASSVATVTPLPAASPSALTTARPPSSSTNASTFPRSRSQSARSKVAARAVGIRARSIRSFAKAFDPSSRAAARPGPKARRPRARSSSARPATSGASGPITTRSASSSSASRSCASTSSAAAGWQVAIDAIPALPGAAWSCSTIGLRANPQQSACSRPPPPTTRTLTGTPSSTRPHEAAGRLCSRAGPTDTTETGTSTSSSIRRTYALAALGRSSNVFASSISSIQPSRSS